MPDWTSDRQPNSEKGRTHGDVLSLSELVSNLLSRKQERERLGDKSFHYSDVSDSVLSTKWEKYQNDLTDERSFRNRLMELTVMYQGQFLSCDGSPGVMEDVTMGKQVRDIQEVSGLCNFSVHLKQR